MKRVVLFGPPGVGKGTQGGRLAAALGVPAISTGDLFRAHVANGTDLGKRLSALIAAGDYVPDSITNSMLAERLAEPDAAGGFLLDGYPRTADQVAELDRVLALSGTALDAVLLLAAPDEVLLDRLTRRAAGAGPLRRHPGGHHAPTRAVPRRDRAARGALRRRGPRAASRRRRYDRRGARAPARSDRSAGAQRALLTSAEASARRTARAAWTHVARGVILHSLQASMSGCGARRRSRRLRVHILLKDLRDLHRYSAAHHRRRDDPPADPAGHLRPHGRHVPVGPRPDGRRHGDPYDRRRPARPRPAGVGHHRLPDHLDDRDADLRQAQRPLRPPPAVHLRDQHLRRRVARLVVLDLDADARRLPRPAGHRRRWA